MVRQYNRIQSLIGRTSAASGEDVNLQIHWGNYLCVLTAGLLESSIREIYGEFVRNTATSPRNSQVARYAVSRLEGIQNPNAERFIQTARAFNDEWGQELENYLNLNDSQRKNAIDSIMSNRNQIAHGRNANISVARVKEYLQKAVEVIDYIEWQCDGN